MIRDRKVVRAKQIIASHIKEAKEAKLLMLSRERAEQ
jgi:hypothetical protein